MTLREPFVTGIVRFLLKFLCVADSTEAATVPVSGPGILIVNHINFLEVPLLYCLFRRSRPVGIVKRETWDNPVLRILADAWGAIPIKRHGVDRMAMELASAALRAGRILIIAPEGTRSGSGKMGRGFAGVVTLAVKCGVPLIPLAHFGGERFWDNVRNFRRTRVTFRAGRPFRLIADYRTMSRTVRLRLADEVMERLAVLLPEEYRGVYEGKDDPDPELIQFAHDTGTPL